MIAETLLIIAFGLIIGSFLSVCIYRIPLGRFDGPDEADFESEEAPPIHVPQTFEGKEISFSFPPRSLSPCCKKQLAWWHNIPLFSWLALFGKCAFCKKAIPIRYPLVEISSAVCAYLSAQIYGLTPSGALVYLMCCALIVITVIDYDYFIIPNLITYPGIYIGAFVALLNEWKPIFDYPVVDGALMSALGVLAGGGFLYLVSEVYFRVRKIDGLGLGDVKLLIMTGALFGPEAALFTIFFGSLLGSFSGLFFIVVGGRAMSQHLPFGPSLALATILYLFIGPEIAEYLNLPLSLRP